MMTPIRTTLIILLTLMLYNAAAQKKWTIRSAYLNRPDTVLVFRPKGYDPKKAYTLLYLLHGYSENYRQWATLIDGQQIADRYQMILVMPDGFTSWYLNSVTGPRFLLEDFFFKELVPKVHAAFHIDKRNIFISGLSMGGYGALRYFLHDQHYFNAAGSTSGALILSETILVEASVHFFKDPRITNDLKRSLGDLVRENWQRYSIPEMLKAGNKIKPFILECGTSDILLPTTRLAKQVADSLNLPVTYIEQPGGHNASYWKQSIQ